MKNCDIFKKYHKAIENADEAGMRQLLAPDAHIWYNFKHKSYDESEAPEDLIRTNLAIVRNSEIFRHIYDLPSWDTPDGFVVQSTCHNKTLKGNEARFPICFVGTIDDQQRISSYKEWLDPTPIKALFNDLDL